MSGRGTSNDTIRDLIDRNRLESKSDMNQLFSKLEARFDELSLKVDGIDKAQAVSSTKISMIVAGISIVVSSTVGLLFKRIP